MKMWGAMMLHTLFMFFVFGPFIASITSGGGGDACTDLDDTECDDTETCSWDGSTSTCAQTEEESSILMEIIAAIGPFIHVILMPVFMKKKKDHMAAELERATSVTQLQLEPGGKTVVFNIKYTLKQKIFVWTVGLLIWLGGKIVSVVKYVGLDLSSLWFPLPFFEFWQAQLQIQNYRILGAKLRLNASMADAYFLFLSEGLYNFYTMGFYSRGCSLIDCAC